MRVDLLLITILSLTLVASSCQLRLIGDRSSSAGGATTGGFGSQGGGALGAFSVSGLTGGPDSKVDLWLASGIPTVNWGAAINAANYGVRIENTLGSVVCAEATATGTSYTFPGSCTLTEGQSYRAFVTARSSGGEALAASNNSGLGFLDFTVDMTPPPNPTIQWPALSAEVLLPQYEYRWSDSSDAVSGTDHYRIEYFSGPCTGAPVTTTTTASNGLLRTIAGSVETARVSAIDHAGNVSSGICTGQLDLMPPPANLVPTFADAGIKIFEFGQDSGISDSVASFPDAGDKIVIAGGRTRGWVPYDNKWEVFLARLNPDGSFDPSFGAEAGVTFVRLSDRGMKPLAAAKKTDGKYVVSGIAYENVSEFFFVAQFNADGTVDSAFGEAGRVVWAVNYPQWYEYQGVAAFTDGSVVVAGETEELGNRDIVLFKFTPAGKVDAGFGTGGKLLISTADPDGAGTVAVDLTGHILVGGYRSVGGQNQVFLSRRNADGTPDPTFAGSGTLLINAHPGVPTLANTLALDETGGKIFVGGNTYGMVIKLGWNGALDTTFAGTGIYEEFATGVGQVYDLHLLADDSLAAACDGWSGGFGARTCAMRVNANGTPDTSFDGDSVAYDNALDSGTFRSIIPSPGGGWQLTGGGGWGTGCAEVALSSRFGSTGAFDATYATFGRRTLDFGRGDDQAHAFARLAGDKLLAAGITGGHGSNFALLQLNSDGTLDTSFNSTGFGGYDVGNDNLDRAYAVAVQPDGKIVAAGSGWGSGGTEFALLRLTAVGAYDGTFGGGTGFVKFDFTGGYDQITSIALQGTGEILAAGTSSGDFAVARLTSAGDFDTTFNGTGKRTINAGTAYDAVHAVRVQSDGNILLAGTNDTDVVLARVTPAGAMDATFGGGTGIVSHSFYGGPGEEAYGLHVLGDGRIIIVGRTQSGLARAAFIARLNADGTLDGTFGTGGVTTVAYGSQNVEANKLIAHSGGGFVVAGYVNRPGNTDSDLAIWKFTAAGALDTAFSGDGELLINVGGGSEWATGLAELSDGSVVVTGTTNLWGSNDLILVRLVL